MQRFRGDAPLTTKNKVQGAPAMEHPSTRSRLARAMRHWRSLKGVPFIARKLVDHAGDFVVCNAGAWYAGRLDSFIDRQNYLLGGYECDLIAQFLKVVPKFGTVLDVGANVGNHSVAFGVHFDRVLAFEPNPGLWAAFNRNRDLNRSANIELMPLGLGDVPGEFQLYDIASDNKGLATFLEDDQYNQELITIATAKVVVADDLMPDIEVDAVKIDVQGFEPQALRGMQKLLERNRPVVWTEFGLGTQEQIGASRRALEKLFPYDVRIMRFSLEGGLVRKVVLKEETGDVLVGGDYVVVPC